MEDNKQLTFIQDITEMKIDSEIFKTQIRLFSQYLTYSNENYKYNETYLEDFCQEFIRFKKYVELKNDVFVELCKKILCSGSNLDVVLIIDEFWMLSTIDGKITARKDINQHKVCNNQIQIKANLQFSEKDYLFFREYDVIKKEMLLRGCIDQICIDFMGWIEEITNDRGNKEI